MDSKFNPFKSRSFFLGVATGVALWAGISSSDLLLKVFVDTPSIFVLVVVLLIIVLHAISIWASQQKQEFAKADIRNFGSLIASSMLESAHSITGLGTIGLLHYIYTLEAGSNLQLFFLCFYGAIPFYWFASFIFDLINKAKESSTQA